MTSPWLVATLGGAGLALLNGMHCLTMCGPLSAAAAHTSSGASTRYLLGRTISYGTLGLIAGSVGGGVASTPWARWGEALLAWALALLLLRSGLALFGVGRRPALIMLGRSPRQRSLARVLAHVAHDPLLLGAATALLPCAALYAAVLGSAALGSGALGAVFMLSFALVTSPILLGGAQLGRLARLGTRGRRVLGAVVLAGALVTALRPLSFLRAEPAPSCPLHPAHAAP